LGSFNYIRNYTNDYNVSLYVSFVRLVGDVLLATAFLSYSGPFNQEFRDVLLNCWKKEMRRNKIPFSEVIEVKTSFVLLFFSV